MWDVIISPLTFVIEANDMCVCVLAVIICFHLLKVLHLCHRFVNCSRLCTLKIHFWSFYSGQLYIFAKFELQWEWFQFNKKNTPTHNEYKIYQCWAFDNGFTSIWLSPCTVFFLHNPMSTKWKFVHILVKTSVCLIVSVS